MVFCVTAVIFFLVAGLLHHAVLQRLDRHSRIFFFFFKPTAKSKLLSCCWVCRPRSPFPPTLVCSRARVLLINMVYRRGREGGRECNARKEEGWKKVRDLKEDDIHVPRTNHDQSIYHLVLPEFYVGFSTTSLNPEPYLRCQCRPLTHSSSLTWTSNPQLRCSCCRS